MEGGKQLQTGDILSLQDEVFQLNVTFLVEAVSSTTFVLAKVDQPYQRLHLTNKGIYFKSASPNRDNLLYIESIDRNSSGATTVVVIRTNNKDKPTTSANNNNNNNCAVQSVSGTNNWCLGIDSNGNFVSIPFSSNMSRSVEERGMLSCFFCTPANNNHNNNYYNTNTSTNTKNGDNNGSSDSSVVASSSATITTPSSLLKSSNTNNHLQYRIPYYQLQRFIVEGYMHLSEVLPASLVTQLNNYLFFHLGQVGTLVLGGVQGGNTGKFPGQVSNSEEIRQVVDKLQDMLKELLHPIMHRLQPHEDVIHNQKNASAQIAFRYPQLRDYHTNYKAEDIEWHTDGYRQGYSHPFSLLVGVSLSDVTHDFEGNLAVWPSSHYLLHRCRRGVHGDLDLTALCNLTRTEPKFQQFYHPTQDVFIEQLKRNKAPEQTEEKTHDNSSSRLPCLGKPVQLRTKPGDVVILHPDLAHGGAPNYSGAIREMLYFRVKVPFGGSQHVFQSWEEVIEMQGEDMWADYLGLKDRVGKEELREITKALY